MAAAKRKKTGGRRPGSLNKNTHDVRALAQEFGHEAVRQLAFEMRHATDSRARSMAACALLDRGFGRAGPETRVLDLPGGSLTERAQAALDACAAGLLSPSEAGALMNALGALAKIVETDELMRRMGELEAKYDK